MHQQTFRTGFAKAVLVGPGGNRLYFRIGSAAFSYATSAFFTRLAGNEALMDSSQVPVNPGNATAHPEKFLRPDSFFYAENGSGWNTGIGGDGQDRLGSSTSPGFDIDSDGYVYLAYTVFGWGIVKDPLNAGGTGIVKMVSQSYTPNGTGDFAPSQILVGQTSGGQRFVITSNQSRSLMWDVAQRNAPRRLGTLPWGLYVFAKNQAQNRVAVINSMKQLAVMTMDELRNGATPAWITAPDGTFESVASDGTNFFAASRAGNGQVSITVVRPNGSTLSPIATSYNFSKITYLTYGGGYLALAGTSSAGIAVWKVDGSAGTLADVSLGNWVANYYSGLAGYTNPPYGGLNEAQVVADGGKTYLILCANSLGDVYELQSGDGITVSMSTAGLRRNPNTPVSTAIYPGDPLQFTATAASGNSLPLTWDFGDGSSAASMTGQPVSHTFRASGTFTVTAYTGTNAANGGTFSVTVGVPAARISIGGNLITAANAVQSGAAIAGDTALDASDGSLDSHSSTWILGGAAGVVKTPADAFSIGACRDNQTLSLDAAYPLSGPTVTAHLNYGFSVRPFTATISYADNGSSLTFNGVGHVTTDATLITSPVHWTWSVINGTTPLTFDGGTGVSPLPWASVPKTTFSGSHGLQVQLSGTAATTGDCANFGTYTTATAALNPADPKITGGCTAGGPPCSYSVDSLSGVDPVADGWSYAWSVSPSANVDPASGTGRTFAPIFKQVGAYTVSVTATNKIGQGVTQQVENVTTAGSACGPIPTNGFVFIHYSGPTSSCSEAGGTCAPGESVPFSLHTFGGYDLTCGTPSYSWSVNNVVASTQPSFNYSFPAQGTYTVAVVFGNGSESKTFTQQVSVGAATPQCGIMTAGNVFITATSPTPSCNAQGGTCGTLETISFSARSFGYDFTCAPHSFTWSFGDGTHATGQTASHQYANPGTYTVSVLINNGTQPYSPTGVVVVGGGQTSCDTMRPNTVFVDASQPGVSTCFAGGGKCATGQAIAFNVAVFGYNFECAPHNFSWTFGDGSTASGRTSSHIYSTAGVYTVKATISNAGQTFIAEASIIASAVNSCPTMTPQNFTIGASSLGQACGSLNCTEDQTINFTVIPNGYSFTCAPHTFTWEFGDGASTTGFSVSHTYQNAGTYPVKLTINNGQSLSISNSLTIVPAAPVVVPVLLDFSVVNAGGANSYLFIANPDPVSAVDHGEWDFGDGTTSGQLPTAVLTGGFTHTYIDGVQQHTVTLNVYDVYNRVVGSHTEKVPGTGKRRAATHG